MLPHFVPGQFFHGFLRKAGPKQRGLQTVPQCQSSSVRFLLPCLSPQLSPCQVPKPFLHQSKEWPPQGRKEGAICSSGAAVCYRMPKFLEPCDWSISCEINYLEGLRNNQRKGARTRSCALCLPISCHPGDRVEMCSSLRSGARLPFHSSPWSQLILGFHPADGKSLWELVCMPHGQRHSSLHSPSQPTWTLALGTMFLRMPALRLQE